MSRACFTIAVLVICCCALASIGDTSTPVNGGWSSWSPWTLCSKTCAGGIQIQTRTCTNPPPSGGGITCLGLNYARRGCPCDQVNGGWSAYGAWSACTVSCGGGTRTRKRTCTNPPPSCCGAECNGLSSETGTCNPQSCNPIEIMAEKFATMLMVTEILSVGRVCLPNSMTGETACRNVCTYGNRDLLMIMDSSGSIGQDNYNVAKLDLAILSASICGNLGTDLRVATMQFANAPQKEFAFNEYDDVLNLFDGTMTITYLNGMTRTWLAFEFARDVMFTVANGNRPGAKKQALIITDGKSNGGTDASTRSIAAAQALKESGVEVFALWIGSPTTSSLAEIREYVSDPKDDHVFHVDSVESLNYLAIHIWLAHSKMCCP